MGHIRHIPYVVTRRTSQRYRHTVFQTFDHKEAVDYVKRAQRCDLNAHYAICSRCHTRYPPLLLLPMPA